MSCPTTADKIEKAFQNKSLVMQQIIKFKGGNRFNVPHTSAADRAALPGYQKVCRSERGRVGFSPQKKSNCSSYFTIKNRRTLPYQLFTIRAVMGPVRLSL